METRNLTWNPPQRGEVKCNIGFAWSKQSQISGASLILRDSIGEVLLHSRISYSQVQSIFDAKIQSWQWALNSMKQLHYDKIIFGVSSSDIIQALNKPREWPAIKGHIAELLSLTKDKIEWFMELEHSHSNQGALQIAKSVITGFRFQSYVARGAPRWLW